MVATQFIIIISMGLAVSCVWGHGYLAQPPQRSSAWRFGYNTPTNYDDNQLYCGGKEVQWNTNGGKCGPCGDPWNGVRKNEAGGKYATGTITGNYVKGQILEAKVRITAFHMGWFEFRLCAHNSVNSPVSQSCLDQTVLEIVGNNTSRFEITNLGIGTGIYVISLQLPADVTCQHCVLQWKYNTGNSWGCEGRTCRVGLGPQEQFINCADIRITDNTAANGPTSSRTNASTTASSGSSAPSAAPSTTKAPTTASTSTLSASSTSSTASSTTTDATGTNWSNCRAVGVWRAVPGMNAWCVTNCQANYCPSSHCKC